MTVETEIYIIYTQSWWKLTRRGSMERPPLSVNVLVSVKNQQDPIIDCVSRKIGHRRVSFTPTVQEANGELRQVVVPIVHDPNLAEWHKRTIDGNSSLGYGPSKVEVREEFNVEPAGATTVHKSEGRTLSRLTLALQSRPIPTAQLSYASMLVGFSRTHTTEELRLFMPNGGGHEDLSHQSD